jgi:hypothetical protein
MGLLAVIAIVLIGLFVRLTASSSKSSDQVVAAEIASRLLEQYAHASPENWMTASAQQGLQTRDPGSSTVFYYQLKPRLITDPSSSQMGDLYRLDVDVYWWQNQSQPNRRDYGRLNVHLARVVFVEAFR